MNKSITQIVIVGGGAAGWLTAGILAANYPANGGTALKITVIESSDIPTIGVGEGTWPTMRDTLATIGLSEHEFISCCDASFKQGSQFIGWQNDSADSSYYHPFVVPTGYGKSDLVQFWQQNNQQSFAHTLSTQAHLCDYGKAPKQVQTPQYAAVVNYGYHLNAGKFTEVLRNHCVNKLGVRHIDDKITRVHGEQDAPIEYVTTEKHGDLEADLFIDCTGQHGLLIDKHYKVPFLSQKHILFNDAAVAVQAPYQSEDEAIVSHTRSTAYDTGWVWDIGLPTRRGLGFVYDSTRTSDEDAQATLLAHLKDKLNQPNAEQLTYRKIKFNPGYRKQFWVQNCVAIGMSAGFIEPLEASALALIELSAKMLANDLPANSQVMAISAKRFNRRFEYRWQRIIDFLKLHYVLSERTSEYWQAHRDPASIPEHLRELLELWRYQPPTFNDFVQVEEIFPSASYQYVLYGMGFKTESRPTNSKFNNLVLSQNLIQENRQLTDKYMAGLPSNRELLEFIYTSYNRQKAV